MGATPGEAAEWIRFVLVVLWLTWLSSTLLTYWGARTTAGRVLLVFGSFWAVFVIATLVGEFSVPHSGAELAQRLLGVAAIGPLITSGLALLFGWGAAEFDDEAMA